MKIIRRRRTVTIETCAFRRWQSQGTEGEFSCPNCGINLGRDPEKLAAVEDSPAKLIAGVEAEATAVEPTEPDTTHLSSHCGGGCDNR